jgi:hypothetical protein
VDDQMAIAVLLISGSSILFHWSTCLFLCQYHVVFVCLFFCLLVVVEVRLAH